MDADEMTNAGSYVASFGSFGDAAGINATARSPLAGNYFGIGGSNAAASPNVAWQGVTSSATYTSAEKALSQA